MTEIIVFSEFPGCLSRDENRIAGNEWTLRTAEVLLGKALPGSQGFTKDYKARSDSFRRPPRHFIVLHGVLSFFMRLPNQGGASGAANKLG